MKIFVVVGVTMLSAAAASQTAPVREISDPGARICKIGGETGTRLGRTRTCKTRAEWDDERLDQRNTLDRAQTKQVNLYIDNCVKISC